MQQAMSHLGRQFPELEDRGAEPSALCGKPRGPIIDVHDFARFVAKQFAQGNDKRVQAAFDKMEELLQGCETEGRDWVCGFLEALQDIACWRASGDEVFVRFLGPATRRTWTALDAIRTDLADCSILEAEVMMWRVVHHQARTACAGG